MKKENEKKPKNKKQKWIKYSILILNFLAMAFLIYSITLISGIETLIRYLAIGTIIIVNILLTILLGKLIKKKGNVKTLIFIISTLILVVGQAYLGNFIYRTYSSIDKVNKDKITYETALVVLKDSNLTPKMKNKKIGITKDQTSIDGYILGLELLKKYNLDDNDTIVEYNDFSSIVADLYAKKIDAAILPETYPSMFKSIKKYENIKKETKILTTMDKTYTKDEIAKYTGEEMINLNASDSITEPFTVLIMGIDSTKENLSQNESGNGDALMLVTFNPKTLNATILSIPRDTYVPISCFANQKENKITHAAWNGTSCMIKTIQNFTGINIDYYVKINFKGVVKLVDTLGGIEVDVPIEFCEQNSDRKWGSKQICLKKGKQTLNGEQALALSRHRKTLATGDLQRGVNQQLVVQSMLNKVKSIKSANQALNILETVSNNMDTNFTTKQLLSFYDILSNLIATNSNNNANLINIQQLYLYGAGQSIYDEGIGLVLWNYIPNQSSLNKIVKVMKQNLGLEKITDTEKKMNFNIEEKFKMQTIGDSGLDATNTYTLLPNFEGSTLNYARNWLSARGIAVTVKEETVSSSSEDGIVLKQNLPQSKRIDLIGSSGITLTVGKYNNYTPPVEIIPPVDDSNNDTPNDSEEPNPSDDPTLDDDASNDDNSNTDDPTSTEDSPNPQ